MPKIGLTKITAAAKDESAGKSLIQFKDDCKNSSGMIFSFKGIVPVPEKIKDGDEKTRYDWYLLNWGTNCDAIHPEKIKETDSEVSYHFYSAWSPPQKFVISASRKFPKLNFWFEYEMNYLGQKGKQEIKDGKVLSSEGNGIFLDDHSMKLLLLQIHNMSGKEEEPDLRL